MPLIENVPPVLRMRVGGVFLSQIGGHWRDLRRWHARVPTLRFTFDTSHAALFRSFAAAYPPLFGLESDEDLDLARYVEELARRSRSRTSPTRTACSARAFRYGAAASSTSTPSSARLGELVARYVVAEINEPDPARSPDMKAGYAAIERALAEPSRAARRRPGGGCLRDARLAVRPRPPGSRARAPRAAGALRRAARPRDRRRRLDRPRAHELPARLPARADRRSSTATRRR